MAVIQVEFHSEKLKRQVSFRAILPTETFEPSYPTLYLLHGLTDNSSAWLYNTRIRMWAEKLGLAVILPSGENSFYLDVPIKDGCYGDFGEYIGRELVDVTRKMFPRSHKREDTFIGGLSMGGYGACRNGLKYCGTEDHLIGANRSIATALKEAGACVTYEEGPGIHDWYFGDTYIQNVLKWLDIKRLI